MSTVGNTSLDAYLGPPKKINGVDVYTMDRYKMEPPPGGFNKDSYTWHTVDFSSWTHMSSVQNAAERSFSSTHLSLSEHIGSVAQPLLNEVVSSAKEFFSGRISADSFAKRFTQLTDEFVNACKERQYPNALAASFSGEPALLGFYEEARRLVLKTAVSANFEEGKQFLTGEMNSQRIMIYYNSDYYYMSEDAISAIDENILSYAKGKGMEEFEIPDYNALGWNQYDNFNSVFSCNPNGRWNNGILYDDYILDYDMVPPKGFRWFYQSGGSAGGDIREISHSDKHGKHYIDYSKFDPTNHLTATTWAAYTDSRGKLNYISTDFNFGPIGKHLYNPSELLTFSGGKNKEFAEVNNFLKNFRVFQQGYCSWDTTPRTGWSARA